MPTRIRRVLAVLSLTVVLLPVARLRADFLNQGDTLHVGDALMSSDGAYELKCLYSFYYTSNTIWLRARKVSTNDIIWTSLADVYYSNLFPNGVGYHTDQWSLLDDPDGYASMQSDGNFVLYDTNANAGWATNTQNHAGAYLSMQTDANIVVYSSTNVALWSLF